MSLSEAQQGFQEVLTWGCAALKWLVSLTPALSRWEREPRWPLSGEVTQPDLGTGIGRAPKDGGQPSPLPAGEGKGEGESSAQPKPNQSPVLVRPFSLTPTLSRWEREPRRPLSGEVTQPDLWLFGGGVRIPRLSFFSQNPHLTTHT